MTNEETREILEDLWRYKTSDVFSEEEIREALDLAIEALEQQPSDDCISREAVMKCFKKWQPYMATRLLDYEQELKELPSVPPKAKWIPVSERLPEVNQRVLVTSYGRVCYAMMISADGNSGYPVFRLQDSLNERVVCETTVHSEFTTGRIVAWMPLPEPYKAEGSEE
jgi:hypothetical protein